jgi:hypothetical protein
LFYDLAVVVLVAAVYALVWIAWANGSLHHELHDDLYRALRPARHPRVRELLT